MDLKYMTDEQLRYGIERCRARLSGVMPVGLMKTTDRIRTALKQYRDELTSRGQNEIEFE